MVFIALFMTFVGALVTWPYLIFRTIIAVYSGTSEEVRNSLLAVGALIGVPFLVWRTLIAAKQTEINRESHYTALFTKAVEQLGAEKTVKRRNFKQAFKLNADTGQPVLERGRPVPVVSATGDPVGEYESLEVTVNNYEVRLGAIYALERIAQDSHRDSRPIYLTLCAYLQNNAPPALVDLQEKPARENDSDLVEVIYAMSRYASQKEESPIYEFVGLHLPDVFLFEDGIRGVQFNVCSQKSATYESDLEQVSYVNCKVGNISLNNASAHVFNVVGGDVEKLQILQASLLNSHLQGNFKNVNVDSVEATITTIQFAQVSNIVRSSFKDCSFFPPSHSSWRQSRMLFHESKFLRCDFRQCDLSFVDFSSSQFQECEFYDCNLVGSGLAATNGNKIHNCLTDEDIASLGEEVPRGEVHQRWLQHVKN
ncbi:pentapeptide repeat-containing protein [Pseudorhizobium pelagicum]|uniref:Pentapeptide repeat-containing protein n=2 Tax=Pseudorhizobium pelagicum TaxID=1509405 RepID=A0A922P652_9HYPH|nr:pentapeptide repeat-containing protein [Pseudorhizobium pelagicum]KEQ08059.1 hypothetical protein GV67_17880 [Pseudorhizobium pelagicum]KEQ10256.1 hypothetical protein GV68_15150 [Pseudorhizobium pelagicum]